MKQEQSYLRPDVEKGLIDVDTRQQRKERFELKYKLKHNNIIGQDGSGPSLISITHADLKALRDSGELIPGQQYRITDYHCTTVQENTQSADHQFDIIVTADDEYTLNENARACVHEHNWTEVETSAYITTDRVSDAYPVGGEKYYFVKEFEIEGDHYFAWQSEAEVGSDMPYYILTESMNPPMGYGVANYSVDNESIEYTEGEHGGFVTGVYPAGTQIIDDIYFRDQNLSKWELKYTLDNDKCTWCSSDGTGAILYMKDDKDNEAFYDFKNILFARYLIVDAPNNEFIGSYMGQKSIEDIGFEMDYDSVVYRYTFDANESNSFELGVDASLLSSVYSNHSEFKGLSLNVFYGTSSNSNRLLDVCNSNTFGSNCSYNVFGNYCQYNTFSNGCQSNTFGNSCYSNTFGTSCSSNTFGTSCSSNTFGTSCPNNTFGNGCQSNTFGNSCQSNTFGNSCQSNTFGTSCSSNTFGTSCSNNTFGNNCPNNIFGNYCNSNTFGNYCNSNTFGNACSSNTFGNGSAIDYCRYIALGDGVQYCNIYGTTTPIISAYLQNIKVAQGLQGTNSGNKLTIEVPTGLTYDVYVGKTSSGVLKKWCPADNISTEIEEDI